MFARDLTAIRLASRREIPGNTENIRFFNAQQSHSHALGTGCKLFCRAGQSGIPQIVTEEFGSQLEFQFKGRDFINRLITMTLMFAAPAATLANYLIMANLGWIDTWLCLLVPALGSSFSLYLIRGFVDQFPDSVLEAARIDGANGWQTLTRVTIPNVMPSITICMFLSLTNGFKLFDQNLALTGGLPYIINPDGSSIHTTEMLALNIYDTFYGQGSAARGTAQAKAVLFFILVAGLGLMQLGVTRKKEVQQ